MADASLFAEWAAPYRKLGLWPRPIFPGMKACKLPEWQRPDSEIGATELTSWLRKYASHGIGLLLGTPFPDGTVLGGLDIDRDDYVRVARPLLGGIPLTGRVGARGIMYFVRVKGDTAYHEFKIKGKGSRDAIKVGELLVAKRLAVIPPTIHPTTDQPYRWVGRPLHEVHWTDLPVIEVSHV